MELLHSREFLQATQQFHAHVLALSGEEHRLLGMFLVPGGHQRLQCEAAADVSTTMVRTASPKL